MAPCSGIAAPYTQQDRDKSCRKIKFEKKNPKRKSKQLSSVVKLVHDTSVASPLGVVWVQLDATRFPANGHLVVAYIVFLLVKGWEARRILFERWKRQTRPVTIASLCDGLLVAHTLAQLFRNFQCFGRFLKKMNPPPTSILCFLELWFLCCPRSQCSDLHMDQAGGWSGGKLVFFSPQKYNVDLVKLDSNATGCVWRKIHPKLFRHGKEAKNKDY